MLLGVAPPCGNQAQEDQIDEDYEHDPPRKHQRRRQPRRYMEEEFEEPLPSARKANLDLKIMLLLLQEKSIQKPI